jgi:hypothetical protein
LIKNLDFKLHNLEKYEELKNKGFTDKRIAIMFPCLMESMEEMVADLTINNDANDATKNDDDETFK